MPGLRLTGVLGRNDPAGFALQMTRAGVAACNVSVPRRYMHSAVEMISLHDIDACADLLATFAHKLAADADFTPH